MKKESNKILNFISFPIIKYFIFFFLISLLIFKFLPRSAHFDNDSTAYYTMALNFAQRGDLNYSLNKMPLEVQGYSFLIGLWFKFFGSYPFAVVFLQILVSILCLFLILKIGHLLFINSYNFSLIMYQKLISIFFIFNIGFFIFTQLILTEAFSVFFLLLFIYNFLIAKKEGLYWSAFFAGLSILIKPAILFFPILLLPILFYQYNLKKVLTFLCLFYIFPLLYTVRNFYIFGEFKLSNVMTVNLYKFFAQKIEVALPHLKTELEVIKKNQDFLQFLKMGINNFWVFSKIVFTNVLKTIFGLYTTHLKVMLGNTASGQHSFLNFSGSIFSKFKSYIFEGTDYKLVKLVALFEFVFNFLRFNLSLLGLFYLFIQKQYLKLYFILSYIFYFLIITGPDGCGRLRMPIEPFLILLSVLGIIYLQGFLWNKKQSLLEQGQQV